MNVFWRSDHCHQWFFDGFLFSYHRFQWFSMVPDHWSNDAMVSMDRSDLVVKKGEQYTNFSPFFLMCCSGWIKLVGGDHHGKEAGVAAFSTFALQVEVEDSAEPRLFTEEEMVTMDNEDKEERDMEDFRELQLRVEKKVLA